MIPAMSKLSIDLVSSMGNRAAPMRRYASTSMRCGSTPNMSKLTTIRRYYGQKGYTDETIREYQATLRIDPDYAAAHYNLGLIYGLKGSLVEARRETQWALHWSCAGAGVACAATMTGQSGNELRLPLLR